MLRRLTRADLRAERDDLAAQVDALAFERDDLLEQLDRATTAQQDLRRVNQSAFERTKQGTPCTKVRYMYEEDAFAHAVWAAALDPGVSYGVYRCGSCRAFPANGVHPYHVGHTRPGKKGAVTVIDGVVHHACGCKYGLRLRTFVWRCPDHREVVS